ncbi:PREDICTED: uncharacterized protein LOC104818362 isoform X2 [Tarenaya hassleriana]|uniref:uncharacterized protein LOC104818362 isoform X2 n=1 Tax=Tarenaya hassleriana TaxID=28532 RepID=UPI00053C2592|nr:PREDICTED: uncharacterized protein LOC104818362 isoform X2 [Tarenaya hassleriana]
MFLPSLPCFGESNHRMSNDSTMPPPSTDSNSDAVQLSENPPFPPHLNTSDTISAGRASSPQQATELSSRNGVADRLSDEIPELPQFSVLDSKAYADKYRKYESEYTQMLMAKYFSVKNIYGGNIFEEKTMIGGETIMSSRWPCTRSYAQPMQCFHEQNNKDSAYSDKPPGEISNGDVQSEKNKCDVMQLQVTDVR